MNFNKKNNIVILLFIISVIILCLIYYLLNYYENYKDLKDTSINNQTIDEIKNIVDNEEIVSEPSGKCNTQNDIVDFCINV